MKNLHTSFFYILLVISSYVLCIVKNLKLFMLLCTYLLLAYSMIGTTTTQPSSSIDPCTVNPSSVVCAAAVMDDESGNDIAI